MPEVELDLDYYSPVAIGPVIPAGPYYDPNKRHSNKECTCRTDTTLVPVPVPVPSHSNRRPTGRRCGLWALGSGYWHRPRCQFGIACPQSLTPGPCRSQGTIDHTFTPTRVKASRLSSSPGRLARLACLSGPQRPCCTLLALHHSSILWQHLLATPVRHSLMPQLRRCSQLLETSSLSLSFGAAVARPSPAPPCCSRPFRNASASCFDGYQDLSRIPPGGRQKWPRHECESSHSSASGDVLARIGG